VIVEDIVTLLIIIPYKIYPIRSFNVQLTLRGLCHMSHYLKEI